MIFKYAVNYDSKKLRGLDDPDTPRPWDIQKEVAKYSGNKKILLDVGCGTGFKLISLAEHFSKILAVDIVDSMTEAAQENFKRHNIKNAFCITADSEALPFPNHSVDVISCMLSRFRVSELARVLKIDGVIVAEYPGCEDKKEFKKFFGKDQSGWRGQFIDRERDDFISAFHKEFSHYFRKVQIRNGFWNTFYTHEGLLNLLNYTPTVRDFDRERDAAALSAAVEKFKTPSGVKLEQNRILIYASDR